jgi:uncharacterized repeat protein (TIGR01451 family)
MRSGLLVLLLLLIGLATPAGAMAAPNLSVTISDSPDPVAPGANITYSIGLTNTGDANAQNVSLSDAIPAGTTFISATAPPGWVLSTPAVGGTGTVSASTSSVAPGAHPAFSLTVSVGSSAAAGTTIGDTVSTASNPADTDSSNNSASATTTVERAQLTLALVDMPDPVAPSHNVTYSIGLNNEGKVPAQNVTLTDTLPSGTKFVSATAPPGWTSTTPAVGGTGTVTFSKATMAAQQSEGFRVVLSVNSDVPDGSSITNFAQASTGTPETNPADNSAGASTRVSTAAELQVTNVPNPNPVDPGTDMTYGMSAINSGAFDAQDVVLDFPVPPGTDYVSVTQIAGPDFTCSVAGGRLTCTLATLPASTFATLRATVHVQPSAAGSTLESTVSVTTTSAENNTADNTASSSVPVNAAPPQPQPEVPPPVSADLSLKTARHGRKLTLSVTNKGALTAASARLRLTLPRKLKASEPKGCKLAKRRLVCKLGNLASGKKAKRVLKLRPQRKGKFRFKVRATSSTRDAAPANNSALVVLRFR